MIRTAIPIRPHTWLIAAMLFAAAALLPSGPAHACACCGTYRVINVESWDVLNVRSGPGVSYQIIETLAPDDGCIVRTGERKGNWVRIMAKGITGWVNRKYLQWVP